MQFKTAHNIILATKSPRRIEYFEKLNIPFCAISSDVDEKCTTFKNPSQYVEDVAMQKANALREGNPTATIIASDTIVYFRDEILHKPKNKEEAKCHLRKLSGQSHVVYTAVVCLCPDGKVISFVEQTTVTCRNVSDTWMDAYIETGDPFDKAGGYGIQTDGVFFVEKIDGDYLTVVGLPLSKLTAVLLEHHIIEL